MKYSLFFCNVSDELKGQTFVNEMDQQALESSFVNYILVMVSDTSRVDQQKQ
jgi:hypothetical protein